MEYLVYNKCIVSIFYHKIPKVTNILKLIILSFYENLVASKINNHVFIRIRNIRSGWNQVILEAILLGFYSSVTGLETFLLEKCLRFSHCEVAPHVVGNRSFRKIVVLLGFLLVKNSCCLEKSPALRDWCFVYLNGRRRFFFKIRLVLHREIPKFDSSCQIAMSLF